jgi:hypothetical protein
MPDSHNTIMEATMKEQEHGNRRVEQKCPHCGKPVTGGLLDFEPDDVCEECYERLTEDYSDEEYGSRGGGNEREVPF